MKILNTENKSFNANLLTLSFSGDLEKDYLASYFKKSLRHVRLSLLLAILIYSVFGILDYWAVPNVTQKLWFIRYALFCPYVILVFLFSYNRYFRKYIQFAIFTVVLFAGVGIIAMIIIAPLPETYSYYTGLILVFLYGYTFFKLRFVWATLAGWTIVIAYEFAAIILTETPMAVLINNNFFFLAGNFMGMIAGYSIEFYSRRDFLHTKLIELEKKNVEEARKNLELRVEERTKELLKVNEELVERVVEQRNAEEALRQSEEQYRTLFEKSTDMIFISTPEGKFIDINPAGVKLFGFSSKEEILTVNIAEDLYANPDEREKFRELIDRDGQIREFEIRLKTKSGNEIIAIETTTALRDETGNILAYLGIIRDITKKRKLENQLFQSQKMDSIGMLTGGIAHDFNNILTALRGYTDLALMKISHETNVENEIRGISRGIERAEDLTRQLLAFGRKQIIEPRVININQVILNLEKMLARLIGEDISLKTILSDEVTPIKADPGQIEQILVNLIINARDAINQKNSSTSDKKITIETKQVYLDIGYVANHPEMMVGDNLMISVSDTGCGMDQNMISKIYEPFYTTKSPGKGTGLGLSTVYGIVKQNNGNINVYSEIHQGTTFKIYWPVTELDINEEFIEESEEELINGDETILFVEDDDEVRKFMVKALKSLRYNIIEAANGIEALKIVQKNNIELDLLITDVVMPEMGGKELAEEIIKHFPGIKILFTSGYTDTHIVRSGKLSEGINFLLKPFSLKDISKKIRVILEN